MAPTILVVDDERFIVEAISQHLRDSDYEVVGLVDSTEALERVNKEDFDLVLTDLRMPDVSGMDIARAVHARGTDTMVIILTGYATLDSAIESVGLNVYAYLNKPFELRELGCVVERALTTQRLKRENEVLRLRVSKMLEDVSTLHEVTRFIYDTDDWATIMEFIMDTLSIGLGITHSCLLLKDEAEGYTVGKANFPAGSTLHERVATCSWKSLETMVSSEEPTFLETGAEKSSLPKELSTPDEPLKGLLFTPIRYRELLLGFLVVFLTEDMEEIPEDKGTLMQILALQIAPQVYQSMLEQPAVSAGASWYSEAQKILRQQIDSFQTSENHIGVNLLRFMTPRPLASQEELESFHQHCTEMLVKHEPGAKIHWLVADTALAFFPGANQVQSEITCMAMADDFRKSELARLKQDGVAQLFYASASWPQEAENTAEFLSGVWARLVNQIHNYTYQQVAAKTGNE